MELVRPILTPVKDYYSADGAHVMIGKINEYWALIITRGKYTTLAWNPHDILMLDNMPMYAENFVAYIVANNKKIYQDIYDDRKFHIKHDCIECCKVFSEREIGKEQFLAARSRAWAELDRWGESETSPIVKETEIIRCSVCDPCRRDIYEDGYYD
jgi:hypothetical protein